MGTHPFSLPIPSSSDLSLCSSSFAELTFVQNKQFLPKETLVYVRLVQFALQALDIYTINVGATGQASVRPAA